MSPAPKPIRVIAICPFTHAGRILVFDGYDTVKRTAFSRPLGGGVERGELAADALRREIREELGQEIKDIQLLGVLENLFECDGVSGHEIVFVFDAALVDESIYTLPVLHGEEDNGDPLIARWRALSEFDDDHRLVPLELLTLLP